LGVRAGGKQPAMGCKLNQKVVGVVNGPSQTAELRLLNRRPRQWRERLGGRQAGRAPVDVGGWPAGGEGAGVAGQIWHAIAPAALPIFAPRPSQGWGIAEKASNG